MVNRILRGRLAESGIEKTFGQGLSKILDQSIEARLDFLPLLSCEAVGRHPCQSIPLMAAWRLLRLSARLLDDVVDGESSYTPAEAINLATGLLFLAPLVLDELSKQGVPANCMERLMAELHEAGLHACAGQQAELISLNDVDPHDAPG